MSYRNPQSINPATFNRYLAQSNSHYDFTQLSDHEGLISITYEQVFDFQGKLKTIGVGTAEAYDNMINNSSDLITLEALKNITPFTDIGLELRMYKDSPSNLLKQGVDSFHYAVDAENYIPEEAGVDHQGSIDGVTFYKKDGEIYSSDLTISIKQSMTKSGIFDRFISKIFIKFPMTDDPYNTVGGGLTLAVAEDLTEYLQAQAVYTISLNPFLDDDDLGFNQPVSIQQWGNTFNLSLVNDPGSKKHFYTLIGIQWSQDQIKLSRSPRSDLDSIVFLLGAYYEKNNYNLLLELIEDAFISPRLETNEWPDFIFRLGGALKF